MRSKYKGIAAIACPANGVPLGPLKGQAAECQEDPATGIDQDARRDEPRDETVLEGGSLLDDAALDLLASRLAERLRPLLAKGGTADLARRDKGHDKRPRPGARVIARLRAKRSD